MLSYCGRQKSAPKKVHALSPGTYDYVTLHNKGTFLRTSSREVILDNLGGPNLVKRDHNGTELSPSGRGTQRRSQTAEWGSRVPAGPRVGVTCKDQKEALGAEGGLGADSQQGRK